jgi:cytoskeletal protein RodZ
MPTPSDQPLTPLSVEELEKVSKKELRKRANEFFSLLDNCGHEQEPAVLAKAQFYLRQLEHRWDSWVSTRDLILELVVIGLIGGEIYMGVRQEHQQTQNFNAQQQVLQNLQTSSQATADTLTSLKTTTEAMNQSVQRSAAATEANAATSAQTLRMSERAYLACAVSMPTPFKAGEKLHLVATVTNAGKGLANDVVVSSRQAWATKGTSAETAQALALARTKNPESPSKAPLAAGQALQQVIDSTDVLTEGDVKNIENQEYVVYTFVEVTYKDLFDRKHRVEVCTYYYPPTKLMANCPTLNKAD